MFSTRRSMFPTYLRYSISSLIPSWPIPPISRCSASACGQLVVSGPESFRLTALQYSALLLWLQCSQNNWLNWQAAFCNWNEVLLSNHRAPPMKRWCASPVQIMAPTTFVPFRNPLCVLQPSMKWAEILQMGPFHVSFEMVSTIPNFCGNNRHYISSTHRRVRSPLFLFYPLDKWLFCNSVMEGVLPSG